MVKNLLSFALLFFGAQLFSSCQKQDTIDPVEDQKGHFKIVFTNSSAQTLAFWEEDPTKLAEGEDCERELDNVSIFVYKSGSDACTYRRDFSTVELEKNTAIFSLPEASYEHNATYDFYAIANFRYGTSSTMPSRADLLAAVQSDLPLYMGLTSSGAASDSVMNFSSIYPSVSGGAVALRNDPTLGKGFVMSSAMISAPVPADENTPRKVELPISRLVNKTEVRAVTSDAFKLNYIEKYGSTLTIDTIKLLNVPTSSYLVASSSAAATGKANFRTVCQIPGVDNTGQSCAVFYGFENGVSPLLSPEIRVCATYDFDGDPLTTDDISKIVYRKKLTMSGAGSMMRNTFYRVDVKINGLTSQQIITTITIAPWKITAVENIDFGN